MKGAGLEKMNPFREWHNNRGHITPGPEWPGSMLSLLDPRLSLTLTPSRSIANEWLWVMGEALHGETKACSSEFSLQ